MTGKSCHSSATNSSSSTAPNTIATANTISSVGGTTTTTSSSSSSTTSSHIQNSLKSLNKASCKISKPLPKSSNPNSASPSPQPAAVSSGSAPPQQSQPPVYNIDKNDFRDVVQKLTGSPAHHQPRPTSGRGGLSPRSHPSPPSAQPRSRPSPPTCVASAAAVAGSCRWCPRRRRRRCCSPRRLRPWGSGAFRRPGRRTR